MTKLIKRPTRWRSVSAVIVPTLWMATIAPAFAQSPPDPPPPAAPPPAPAPAPPVTDVAPPPPAAPEPLPTDAVLPPASAPEPAGSTGPDVAPPSRFARETLPDDPTGGAYTTPTLLFIPAGAVPVWNVRVIVSLDMQGPAPADRFGIGTASGSSAQNPIAAVGFQPGIGGELGLPFGFTLGAGTNWVGGDQSPDACASYPKTCPVGAGLSPYFQLRYHILGHKDGQGWQLGASATYKFVGFQGDPGEVEIAVSSQYRRRRFEIGLQAVIGKDFATTDADAELHLYAVYRVVPQLALGVAGQGRYGVVSQPGETPADVVSGAIASLTLGRWQIAALGGESTIGLSQTTAVKVGGLGEMFATARF